jgi:DNA polymerase-4
MPESSLKNRFGFFGNWLHRHSNGIDNSPVIPPAEAKSISRETTFEQDTRDTVLLFSTLRYLTERVGADLRENGKQSKCVSVKVRYADFTTITRQRTLPQQTDADQTIFQTGNELIQKALTSDKRAIRLIGIGVSNLTEPGQQLSLINTTERLEKLNRAVDRIRDKYGFTAIQTGRTLRLKEIFPRNGGDFTLPIPSLLR